LRRFAPWVAAVVAAFALVGVARAQDAFCTGLRQLVAAAPQGFDSVPRSPRALAGSVTERRGMLTLPDGLEHAAFFAIMLRDDSGQRPGPTPARFNSLHAAIARCLPDAAAAPVATTVDGANAAWTLPQVAVGLRLSNGGGGLATAEVEVTVASRY
jgi:hypothetical protein